MKKNKGFTLIELLAIIVILAIIAVITVPIILNVIDNAKRGTAKDSAYGYKDAINKYYVSGMLEGNNISLNTTYDVVDGKLGEHDIPFSGTKPANGYLTFENNLLTEGCLTIDEYKVTFSNGEVTNVDVGNCNEVAETAYKCKRATVLHTEECGYTTTGYTCSGAGYTVDGSKGTTTITYGNLGRGDVLASGDAFDCDVNGDGEYNPETERFYYVSDLYDKTTQEFDDRYAVLIYYNGTTNGEPDCRSSKPYYSSSNVTKFGPSSAIVDLPTVLQWSNVNLTNNVRNISIVDGSISFAYEKIVDGETVPLAGRLLTYEEALKGCNNNIKTHSCVYLMENSGFTSGCGSSRWWLENVYSSSHARTVSGYHFELGVNDAQNNIEFSVGVRPAIEVLKSDIDLYDYDRPYEFEVVGSPKVNGSISVGDEYELGTEHFYVIDTNENETILFAKYNLNVGNNTQDEQYGKIGMQNSLAIGATNDSSLADSNGKHPGTIAFASYNYWSQTLEDKEHYGDSNGNHIFVYDHKSYLYEHVNNYKKSLEDLGVQIKDARILKYEEAINLGCDSVQGHCGNSSYSFVDSTSYWLGSTINVFDIYGIAGIFGFADEITGDAALGVRPVIVVNTEDLK